MLSGCCTGIWWLVVTLLEPQPPVYEGQVQGRECWSSGRRLVGTLAQFKQQVFRQEVGGGHQVPVANMWLDFSVAEEEGLMGWVVTAGDKAAP